MTPEEINKDREQVLKLEEELNKLKKSHEELLKRLNSHINNVDTAHMI